MPSTTRDQPPHHVRFKLLSDFKMFETLKIFIEAVRRTFGNIFWSALASIICLITFDWGTTGTLIWNYVANDVLGTNNTEARKNAEAIEQAVIFSRGLWFLMLTAFGLTFFDLLAETRKIYREQMSDRSQQRFVRGGSNVAENFMAGGSVSVNIDQTDSYIQQLEGHLDYQYETNRDIREFNRDYRNQWQIRNRNAERLIAATQEMHNQFRIFSEELRKWRYEDDFRRV